MTPPFRYRLSDREKDALLSQQAALTNDLLARLTLAAGNDSSFIIEKTCDAYSPTGFNSKFSSFAQNQRECGYYLQHS